MEAQISSGALPLIVMNPVGDVCAGLTGSAEGSCPHHTKVVAAQQLSKWKDLAAPPPSG